MRIQQEWFKTLASELAEVLQFAEDIAVTVKDFSQALHIRIDKDSTLGLLTKLTALGSVLKQTGLLKPSWFDDVKRAELQQVANTCQKQIDEANRLRNATSERMKATAFDADGEPIAAAASEFEPFWVRMWSWITGDWSRFVQKSAILYSQPFPNNPGGRRGDILRDFFGIRGLVRPPAIRGNCWPICPNCKPTTPSSGLFATKRTSTLDLICDEQGHPRWRDFASGIEAIDRLRALVKIPDRLKQVLTTEGMIDQRRSQPLPLGTSKIG